MSKTLQKSVVLCLFVGCLTAPAFGATRDRREGGGFLAAVKRAIVRVLDLNDLGWPKP
jgi:hypothetical protein